MGEYIHIETQQVMSQGQWRNHYKNVSLPRVWTDVTLAGLKLEPVLETPKPEAGKYQNAVRNGVVKDAKGNWVWAWAVVDMFADDEEGTKAEKEAAYQAGLDDVAAKAVRAERDGKLAATDWIVIKAQETGVAIAPEWAVYRQALRDVTAQAGFPHTVEWPAQPE